MFDFLDNRFDNWFYKYYKIIKNFTVNNLTITDHSFAYAQLWLRILNYGENILRNTQKADSAP